MTQELIYTSARRGLKTGSRGFCTVASTAGMASNLADVLERLSGYRHVFPAESPQAIANPVVYAFVKTRLGGQNVSILSRVSDAGLDYSQRSNKLAHHVAIGEHEHIPAGPAWLISQPNWLVESWSGEPRKLESRTVPASSHEPRVCSAWQSITGDAGWAGTLVESFHKGQNAFLIFQPGMNLLPLMLEAQSLLSPTQRWQATFSTYFTSLPPNIDCRWRCVLADSPEAITARRARNDLVIDLASAGVPPASELVEFARTGKRAIASQPVSQNDWSEDFVDAPAIPNLPVSRADNEYPLQEELSVLPPELRGKPTSRFQSISARPPLLPRREKKRRLWLALAIAVMSLMLVGVGGFLIGSKFVELGDQVEKAEQIDETRPENLENSKLPQEKVDAIETNRAKEDDASKTNKRDPNDGTQPSPTSTTETPPDPSPSKAKPVEPQPQPSAPKKLSDVIEKLGLSIPPLPDAIFGDPNPKEVSLAKLKVEMKNVKFKPKINSPEMKLKLTLKESSDSGSEDYTLSFGADGVATIYLDFDETTTELKFRWKEKIKGAIVNMVKIEVMNAVLGVELDGYEGTEYVPLWGNPVSIGDQPVIRKHRLTEPKWVIPDYHVKCNYQLSESKISILPNTSLEKEAANTSGELKECVNAIYDVGYDVSLADPGLNKAQIEIVGKRFNDIKMVQAFINEKKMPFDDEWKEHQNRLFVVQTQKNQKGIDDENGELERIAGRREPLNQLLKNHEKIRDAFIKECNVEPTKLVLLVCYDEQTFPRAEYLIAETREKQPEEKK